MPDDLNQDAEKESALTEYGDRYLLSKPVQGKI
jgi:hypothetical protein